MISGLGKMVVNTAPDIYHNTMFKIAALALAASMAKGCSKPAFFNNYWPPESVQAELAINSEGSEVGVRGKFEGDNSTLDVKLSSEENKSTIEETGNTVEESRFTADFNIHSKNKKLSVSPVIETSERTVKMPTGEQESSLDSTFVSAGVKLQGKEGFSGPNHLLVRPYIKQDVENTIVGDIDIRQFGIYADGKIGIFLPLFSFERYDVKFGKGITNLQEMQAGLAFSGKWPDKAPGGLLGAYLVSTDNETDQTDKFVGVGDLNIIPAFNIKGSYDGDLLDVGTYGCFGGSEEDSENNSILMREYIRQMQQLNFLARGLPESVINDRKFNLRQSLEQNLDAKVFYVLGVRQKHNTDGWDSQPALYAYLAFNIPAGQTSDFKDRKVIVGPTYGSVFEPYSKDLVDQRYGILCGVYLGKIRIDGSLERVEYQSLKPANLFMVRAFISIPFK